MIDGYQAIELEEGTDFELINAVPYSKIKNFILEEISKKTIILRIYSVVQLVALLSLVGLLVLTIVRNIESLFTAREFFALILGLVFSFTLIIPIHELYHAAAFLLLGKKNIHFGAHWKKFMFYAGADRQVLNRKEMVMVALAPLVINFFLLLIILFHNTIWVQLFCTTIFFTHLFFISGDITIISFFLRHLPDDVYTFDDRRKQITYYYKKKRMPDYQTPP